MPGDVRGPGSIVHPRVPCIAQMPKVSCQGLRKGWIHNRTGNNQYLSNGDNYIIFLMLSISLSWGKGLANERIVGSANDLSSDKRDLVLSAGGGGAGGLMSKIIHHMK